MLSFEDPAERSDVRFVAELVAEDGRKVLSKNSSVLYFNLVGCHNF